MEEKIDTAIENTLAMIRPNCKPDDYLKLSQSVANLAHARSHLVPDMSESTPKTPKPKGANAA